ncbi:MAG TPA: alkaline phosphatase D family protein, partial [Intrasporangium sp.]|nr:alkaline phosphatase D family protein [Intrasporangium sp.]
MDVTTSLVLGPMLRYADETSATVWVETANSSTVTVTCAGRTWEAPTFRVEGHHYALVIIEGLEPASTQGYAVSVDGELVWPSPDSLYPAPHIRTIDRTLPTRLAYGSCRTAVPHDEEGNRTNGVDALRALALAIASGRADEPDLIAFLGDQVYADLTSDAMQEYISERRSLDEPPGEEIKDYEEYAHLYWLAWTDPANRWLLSTVPSCMIFDDHDIRDDWNTSWTWHEEMNRTSWWNERLIGGLASYWVYQHIG